MKTNINITIDAEVYSEARMKHVNISRLCNNALRIHLGIVKEEGKLTDDEIELKNVLRKNQLEVARIENKLDTLQKEREKRYSVRVTSEHGRQVWNKKLRKWINEP